MNGLIIAKTVDIPVMQMDSANTVNHTCRNVGPYYNIQSYALVTITLTLLSESII